MVEVLIQLAKAGDVQALKVVIQHLLPPVQQKTDVSVTAPISVTWAQQPEPQPGRESGRRG